MKKRTLLILGSLILTCHLTACGQTTTPAESRWAAAKKADDTAAYVTEHRDELKDLEAEAKSAESLGQQFKAVALLCMAEYQDNLASADSSILTGQVKHDAFQFNYPNTAAYADTYFSMINTDETAFWESLNDAYYPYDYFLPMLAATANLDGQTLSRLLNETALEGTCKTKLEEAVDAWIEYNPGKIVTIGNELMDMGYFDDWSTYDWTGTYLSSSINSYLIQTDTAEEGLAYVRYMRDSLLPRMESKIGRDSFCSTSDITGEEYYSTDLAVTIKENLQLSDLEEDSLPETIDIEGKKVVAFYHNPTAGDNADVPPAWRILGDFIMGLSDDEIPATLAEADYYLILTSDYQFSDYYQDQSGNSTKIQAAYSSTSIDLYDAATGTLLHHIGKVMENAPDTIFKDLTEESVQYPELVNADILSYIYHNINDPDSYRILLDNTSDLEEPLQTGGTGLLGPWKITMNSFDIVDSFTDGMFNYSASDGCQFVRGYFTVTNRGFQKDSFFPISLRYASDDSMFAGIIDENGENYYPTTDATTYSKCLNGKSVEPEETISGELLFEVPDEAINVMDPLYIIFVLENQMLLYSTEQ